MKNPLTIFFELFGSTNSSIPLMAAVTLEFCYDHVNEDFQIVQEALQLSKHEKNPGTE